LRSDTPAISVIIPAFNEESYLPDTLQAVNKSAVLLLSQHQARAEVIVVDNNSADATARVASLLGARVITELEHNIGRARNCGAAAARAEMLVFLDADTHIPEQLLSSIHQALAIPGCVGGAIDTDWRPRKRSIRVYIGLWRILGKAARMAQGATQFCLRSTFTALGGYASCRRFDRWPLWRTLVWTNPLVLAPLRRARFMWRSWYETPLR